MAYELLFICDRSCGIFDSVPAFWERNFLGMIQLGSGTFWRLGHASLLRFFLLAHVVLRKDTACSTFCRWSHTSFFSIVWATIEVGSCTLFGLGHAYFLQCFCSRTQLLGYGTAWQLHFVWITSEFFAIQLFVFARAMVRQWYRLADALCVG